MIITGFEENSNIYYEITDSIKNREDGFIEFYLNKDSSSFKSLFEICIGRRLFEVTIFDNNIDNVVVKGTSFKLRHSDNNKKWTILDIYVPV